MTVIRFQLAAGLAILLLSACAAPDQSRADGNLKNDPAAVDAALSQAACNSGLGVLVGAKQRRIGDLGMIAGNVVTRRGGVPIIKTTANPASLRKLLADTSITSIELMNGAKAMSKTSAADAAAITAAFADKDAKARIPVIVDLAVERSSKTKVPDKTDMARIKAVQSALTAELGKFKVQGTKSFRYVPQMAFSVDQAAFVALQTSARVCRIYLEKPMNSQTVQ